MDSQDTFTAISTPHGESALGVIRCSGPLCKELIKTIFRNSAPAPRYAKVADYTDIKGQFLDSVVYIYFEENRSYTGDSMMEISCHGNPYILQNVLEDLVNRGCRYAFPGEFTQTAFLNGKMDLSQAEAVIDLIKARTLLSFKAAANQLHGSLSKRIHILVDELLQVIAEIEAYIDFPEEDLPSEGDAAPVTKLSTLCQEIETLAQTAKTGIFLREGVKTIIVGIPNAGKSSLLNMVLREARAIVSDQPGTTRDYIEASFFVDPYRINITDTAGIHQTSDVIELDGISKAMNQIILSDLVLLTIDSSQPPPLLPENLKNLLNFENTILVLNKSDLKIYPQVQDFLTGFHRVRISAKNGEGLENLKKVIGKLLGNPLVSEQGDLIAVSARHHTALINTLEELQKAITLFYENEPAELIASHLRLALCSLESIVGKIDNERMLDKLFSSFCIGK